MKRHLVRCAVAIAAILTVATVVGPSLAPQPILDAQYEESYCRIDRRVENRLRKVRGNVNVECGGDVDPNDVVLESSRAGQLEVPQHLRADLPRRPACGAAGRPGRRC